MTYPERPAARWRKSSASGTGTNTCVEVAHFGERIVVRDSTDRLGVTLAFDASAWGVFVTALRRDEFG